MAVLGRKCILIRASEIAFAQIRLRYNVVFVLLQALTPDELRQRIANWSLESDGQLLQYMVSIAKVSSVGGRRVLAMCIP